MKQKLLFLLLFSFSIGWAQVQKNIHGKVKSGTFFLKDVDIVNMTSKVVTTTDTNGDFSISAKIDDELFIISKEHVDQKITITKNEFEKENLIISLEKKPIELNEVTVTKTPNIKFAVSQSDLDKIKVEKDARRPKVLNVYDGTIVNGIDFIRIGKDIIRLFKGKKEKPKEKITPVNFKNYIRMTFKDSFFTNTLKLKPEEIFLFLSFCETDSKSKAISASHDYFETMDFLISKNEVFKKLNNINK